MLRLGVEKFAAIAAMWRSMGVRRLVLFGSATTEALKPGRSDVDVLVGFGDMGGRTAQRRVGSGHGSRIGWCGRGWRRPLALMGVGVAGGLQPSATSLLVFHIRNRSRYVRRR
jgi:hypothetical protein